MMIFEKIKQEIMADPANESYTEKGIPPLFRASKDASIVIVGQAPGRKAEYFPLVHPSPLNLGWLKRNPWFEKDVLPILKEIVKNC